jgi:hypothetical protein
LIEQVGPQAGLEPLRDGVWTNDALIAAMEVIAGRPISKPGQKGHDEWLDTLERQGRQLRRLEAGDSRVSADLAVSLAKTFGVEVGDLVYTHEVRPQLFGKDTENPIAALDESRLMAMRQWLQAYRVELVPLHDDGSYLRLAGDLADPATDADIRTPWRTTTGAPSYCRPPLRRLRKLRSTPGPKTDQLARDLRVVVTELAQSGLCVRVGRLIHVTESRHPPVLRYGEPKRLVIVAVDWSPGCDHVSFDLLPSLKLRPTLREEELAEGNLDVVPEIRSDIAWSGCWEGRWFPFLPLDLPEWIKRAIADHPRR